MLDELLALSKLEAKTQASTEQPVEMPSLVRDVAMLLSQEERVINVEVDEGLQILGEFSDLTSIVTNLLSNALRYSDAGTAVEVDWTETPEGAVLSVTDHGEGIAEEDLPRLTERFFRVNRGRSRESGGVGLGLAIVKHALARHDAVLSVSSQLGEGSCFRCEFPMERIVRNPVPMVSAVVR